MKATAFAPTNIALAKYWGKLDTALNLPSNGSISVTLDKYGSTTTVTIDSSLNDDRFSLNGVDVTDPSSLSKVKHVLDLLRDKNQRNVFFSIESSNNFPTGAGLASSASGLCALTLAASKALNSDLSLNELQSISRIGSGSSCRSFHGGFVEWKRGERTDGTDSIATSIFDKDHWPLSVLITIVQEEKKHTLSTDGMIATQKTSPYFSSWINYAQFSLKGIREAITRKDLAALADLAEENCIRMHASAMAASPPIIYWQPQTLQIMNLVRRMRNDGMNVFFTIDAGPNVVLFCDPSFTDGIKAELANIGVNKFLETTVGLGARLL